MQQIAVEVDARPTLSLELDPELDVERAAMLLALSKGREEEQKIKECFTRIRGMRFMVTEIGGHTETIKQKLIPLVIGSAISQVVIKKNGSEIHALLHATLEAQKGLMLDTPASGNMSLKIAVTIRREWVAVAIFGESAYSILTNHRRAGLGVMHFNK